MMTERQNEHTFPARFDFALSVLALGIASESTVFELVPGDCCIFTSFHSFATWYSCLDAHYSGEEE